MRRMPCQPAAHCILYVLSHGVPCRSTFWAHRPDYPHKPRVVLTMPFWIYQFGPRCSSSIMHGQSLVPKRFASSWARGYNANQLMSLDMGVSTHIRVAVTKVRFIISQPPVWVGYKGQPSPSLILHHNYIANCTFTTCVPWRLLILRSYTSAFFALLHNAPLSPTEPRDGGIPPAGR
jgi:hypothetical protein